MNFNHQSDSLQTTVSYIDPLNGITMSTFSTETLRGQQTGRKTVKPLVTYLGVTLTSKLNWTHHIKNISSKASQSLGFLCNYIKPTPTEIKEQVYISCQTTG